MKQTIELNQANFQKAVLESPLPVLVDFWADWCGPCKMLAPALEDVAREQQGAAVIAKINIDNEPELASRFNIQSIPTLVYFKNGQVREQTVGIVSKKVITDKLASLTSNSSSAQKPPLANHH